MLNKKGDNMDIVGKEKINEEIRIANSNAWVLVNEVSRTDNDLAMKLDHIIADVKESAYRSGQFDGLEQAKQIVRGGK
jgi:hypothetical protein|tara:strand:- start:483 stop:716 length:234 start_codon:yes stop_codon:yes gene_type:complete